MRRVGFLVVACLALPVTAHAATPEQLFRHILADPGFMFHPKGLHHYDGAKDEETIVEIMGMGPVDTTPTEVDANGRPVPASQ